MKTQQLQLLRKTSLIALLLLYPSLYAAADTIGGIFEQTGNPGSILRTTGETLVAELETDIVSMDNVETTNGRLKIEFVDDTQVSLTEHTFLEINEYVFDPDPSKSKMALNFASGTARFATGKLGLVSRENIQIQTPTASIGIRGTDFTTTVDELGRSLVILLPDANCDDKIKLEEGCKPSGSISVTNDGGQVILDEAFQAVMVSTSETAPTQPVVIENLNLNMIDNMFIVSQPDEVEKAVQEQEAERAGADYLAFNDLDVDFLEENLLEENLEDLEFTELDIDYLNVDLLQDLLDVLDLDDDTKIIQDQGNQLASGGKGPANIRGTINPGYDPTTLYNTIIDGGGLVWFYRVVDGGVISVKIPVTANAKIYTESDQTPSTICVNDCSSINIYIRQTSGG